MPSFVGGVVCAALALLPGRARAGEREQPAAALPVVIVSLAAVDPLALAAMTEEARAILGPVGAHVSWNRDEPAKVRSEGALYVVLLGGAGRGSGGLTCTTSARRRCG